MDSIETDTNEHTLTFALVKQMNNIESRFYYSNKIDRHIMKEEN